MEHIFYNPIVNLFLVLYKLLFENFVLTIIFLTLIVQLILWPLTIKQYIASKKMRSLQEKMKAIQEKRAAGKELNMAEMQLATQAMKGMFAGCLPPLIQLPFLLALYDIITKVSQGNGTVFNSVAYTPGLQFGEGYKFNLDFFGLDLAKTVRDLGSISPTSIAILLTIIAATIIAQYYSVKLSVPQKETPKVQAIDATSKPNKKSSKKNEKTVSKEIKDPVNKEIAASPEQMTKILTVVISIATIFFPAALSVYWLARSIFVIILTEIQVKYIIKEK